MDRPNADGKLFPLNICDLAEPFLKAREPLLDLVAWLAHATMIPHTVARAALPHRPIGDDSKTDC